MEDENEVEAEVGAARVEERTEEDVMAEVEVVVVVADFIEARTWAAVACRRCCTKASATENRAGLTRVGESGRQFSRSFAIIFI